MVVSGDYRGAFGGVITDSIGVYVGSFGLWIIWLMLIAVSMIVILEQTLSELAYPFKEFMEKPLTNIKLDKNDFTTQNSLELNEEDTIKNFITTPSPLPHVESSPVETQLPIFIDKEEFCFVIL